MGKGKGYKGPFWVMESPIFWRLCSYPCACDPAETHKISVLCILSLSYFKILFLFKQIPITVHSLSLLFPSLLASCSGILQRLRLAGSWSFLGSWKREVYYAYKGMSVETGHREVSHSRVLSWLWAQIGVLVRSFWWCLFLWSCFRSEGRFVCSPYLSKLKKPVPPFSWGLPKHMGKHAFCHLPQI